MALLNAVTPKSRGQQVATLPGQCCPSVRPGNQSRRSPRLHSSATHALCHLDPPLRDPVIPDQPASGMPIPAPSLTFKHRLRIVTVGELDYRTVDIGMRMLTPPPPASSSEPMGFPTATSSRPSTRGSCSPKPPRSACAEIPSVRIQPKRSCAPTSLPSTCTKPPAILTTGKGTAPPSRGNETRHDRARRLRLHRCRLRQRHRSLLVLPQRDLPVELVLTFSGQSLIFCGEVQARLACLPSIPRPALRCGSSRFCRLK